jgi:hypothetical protein
MRRTIVLLLVLTAAAVGSVPAGAATVERQKFSSFRDVPVQGFQGRYRLRLSYLVPDSWRTSWASPAGISRRFGPLGSCRYTLRVSGRAVAGPAGIDAATRAAQVLPGEGRLLLDDGTRRNAAWRVVRTSGSDDVTGLLVRPAPTVRNQPPNGRVWLEIRFAAVADPRTECHSGGPRTVAQQTGDALAAAVVGGFEVT